MRLIHSLIAALLMVLLALPATAGAQMAPVQGPLTPYTPDPLVAAAMQVADNQWGSKDCGPFLVTFEDPAYPSAAANPKKCWIGFNQTFLSDVLSWSRSSDIGIKRRGLHDLCMVFMHEKGHLRGYADGDPGPFGGIMTDNLWALWVPQCLAWVNQLAPYPPAYAMKGSGLVITSPGDYQGRPDPKAARVAACEFVLRQRGIKPRACTM